MSLSRDQKKHLFQISEQFKKIEKLAHAKNIDPELYVSQCAEYGYEAYDTDDLGEKRKNIFEKQEISKAKSGEKSH
jgi:hypothetical protein